MFLVPQNRTGLLCYNDFIQMYGGCRLKHMVGKYFLIFIMNVVGLGKDHEEYISLWLAWTHACW